MNAPVHTRIDVKHVRIRLFRADDIHLAQEFSCGDDDLDDFLRSDALRLQNVHTARTHIAFYRDEFVGYITLLNDCVELKTNERKRLSLRHNDHPTVPALKIARLAVSAVARSRLRGTGTALVQFACAKALELSHSAGCRLVTVDAYPESVRFYEKLGFIKNNAKPYAERAHPSMRFDLFGQRSPYWLTSSDD